MKLIKKIMDLLFGDDGHQPANYYMAREFKSRCNGLMGKVEGFKFLVVDDGSGFLEVYSWGNPQFMGRSRDQFFNMMLDDDNVELVAMVKA